jgi:hypothetical protein
MITFCQIWQAIKIHYFVSILHVINLRMVAYAENAHNVACPDLGKTFKFKIRMSQKGTSAQIFPQFWDVFGENPLLHVLILAKPVFKINETLFLGLQTYHPP